MSPLIRSRFQLREVPFPRSDPKSKTTKTPGAMPTTRLSSPKSALRGHVFSLEACEREVWSWGGSPLPGHLVREHLSKANLSRFPDVVDLGSDRMHPMILAERFSATTFCGRSEDMPTQSRLRRAQSRRGHGTQRREGFSLGKTRAFRNVGWDKLAKRATAHHCHAPWQPSKRGPDFGELSRAAAAEPALSHPTAATKENRSRRCPAGAADL